MENTDLYTTCTLKFIFSQMLENWDYNAYKFAQKEKKSA